MKQILTLITLLLLFACQDEQIAGNDARAITVQSTHRPMSGELSRAPYMGNISNSNPLLSRVITFNGLNAGTADAGEVWCDGHILFAEHNGIATYDPESLGSHTGKYPDTDNMYDTYHLTGLHPNDSWTGDATTTSSILTHAITGCDDIMTTPMRTVTRSEVLAAKAPALTFGHRLTKFEVRVKAKNAAVAAIWNRVTAIQLVGIKQYPTMPNTFGYTLDGSAASYTDADESDTPLSFYAIDRDEAKAVYLNDVYAGADGSIPNEDTPTVAYTLAPPFTPTNSGDVTIGVVAETAGGKSQTFALPMRIPTLPEGTTTAGYAYRVVITFSDAEEITATAELADWIDADGEVDLPIESKEDQLMYHAEPLANCYIANEHTTQDNMLIISTRQAIAAWEWMEQNGEVGTDSDGNRYSKRLKTLLADTTQWSVDLLWCTWDNFPAAGFTISRDRGTNRILDAGSIRETNDKVFMIKGLNNVPTGHNAVIALKDNDGKIWWSWHLWFTDYTPAKSGATFVNTHNTNNNGKHFVFMDRNLGATAAAEPHIQVTFDNNPYGLLYQWGRKDPFPSTSLLLADFQSPGSADFSVSPYIDATTGTISHSIANPTVFLLTNRIENYCDWYYGSDGSKSTDGNGELWGHHSGTKTVFDPCPSGWRVPLNTAMTEAGSPWYGLNGDNATALEDEHEECVGYSWGPNANYHASNHRSYILGYLDLSGGTAYFWSASPLRPDEYGSRMGTCLTIDSRYGINVFDKYYRAYGSMVRCVQED